MKVVVRTEQHVLRPTNEGFQMIKDFCHLSKNLYNHANYQIRQQFFDNGSYLTYEALDKRLKQDASYPDYRNMPTAKSAQQTLRRLVNNWKSYKESHKDWIVHPEKYKAEPQIPNYLDKDGEWDLILTNQDCKVKGDCLSFPKVFNGFTMKPQFLNNSNFVSFRELRFIPRKTRIIVELVYRQAVPDMRAYNNRCVGIDLGVNHLAAVANNFHAPVFTINGRILKSLNQFRNKQIAKYQSVVDTDFSERILRKFQECCGKRERQIKDFLHKASKRILDYCLEYGVTMIVIGYNDQWKETCKQRDDNLRQNFKYIPFLMFVNMIRYKAENCGITVVTTEERYTSGTSFVDGEYPGRADYDRSRRVKRGLFLSNKGVSVHADVNAAYQIIKKVVPVKWDSGCVLHPAVVNL